jgi:hypothetical protein
MLALSPEASNEIGPKKGQRKGKIWKLVNPASSHLTIDWSITVSGGYAQGVKAAISGLQGMLLQV